VVKAEQPFLEIAHKLYLMMASDNVMQLIDCRFAQLMHGLHLHTTNICSTVDHKIGQLSNDIREMQQNTIREDIEDLQTDLGCVLERLDKLEYRLDATENESKRKNLKFFGVGERLNPGSMPDIERVVRLLNDYSGYSGGWQPRDLERAFRVGARGGGEPRLLVVQFHRCQDKMDVLNDEVLRSGLRQIGVRISNDLTSKQ
jgi:hypothetical protein